MSKNHINKNEEINTEQQVTKKKKKNLRVGKSSSDRQYADSIEMLLQCNREAAQIRQRKEEISQQKANKINQRQEELEKIKQERRQERFARSQARKERLKKAASMTVSQKKKALQEEKNFRLQQKNKVFEIQG